MRGVLVFAVGILFWSILSFSAEKLEVKGHLRIRGESLDQTEFSGQRSFLLLRARPDFLFHPSSDLDILLQPQFARGFGELVGNQQTSGTVVDPLFGVHQAYADYRPVTAISLIGGRQILSYGDELVIGALDWNNTGRSFDALRARGRYALGWSDVFYSKLVDQDILRPSHGDMDFYGLYNAWSVGPALKDLDLYALFLQDGRNLGTPDLSLWTIGTRAKSSIERFDYRVEAGYQTGSAGQIHQTGYQVDAEAGMISIESIKLRFALNGFQASKNYNQLFPTVHKWIGTADVLGRRNVTGGMLRVSAKPSDRWQANLDLAKFYRTAISSPAFKLNGISPLGTADASPSKDIGTEMDLSARFNASSEVSFFGGASVLFPGEYLTDQFSPSRALFYFLQSEFRF